MVERIKPDWELLQDSKKCDGRTAQLSTIEDQVLCTLLYYRTYNSQEFLGFLFDLHESNICRLLKKIEPIMAKKITIVKDRSLTPEKIMKPLPRDCEKYGDLGYQGWQKIASNVILPIKKKENQPLTTEEKLYNKALASFRVKVEHKFRELKIFRILSGTYRNFRKKLHMRLNIIAGIVNLKHGF